jgi:hypothetical protein
LKFNPHQAAQFYHRTSLMTSIVFDNGSGSDF